MSDKTVVSNDLQKFAEFIIDKMNERFDEQDKRFESQTGILVEDFEHKLAVAVENLDSRIEHHLKPVKEDVAELKTDMKVVKAAVTASSRLINAHERRISRLEANA